MHECSTLPLFPDEARYLHVIEMLENSCLFWLVSTNTLSCLIYLATQTFQLNRVKMKLGPGLWGYMHSNGNVVACVASDPEDLSLHDTTGFRE